MKPLPIISKVLLAFVLLSIGFAVGKQVTLARIAGQDPTPSTQPADQVVVYYMHATIRCVTCNQIEQMTQSFLQSNHAADLNSGRLLFKEINFQADRSLAEAFDVTSSCVVVASLRAGQIARFRRLGEVWTLYDKPEQFNAHLAAAIAEFLPPEGS